MTQFEKPLSFAVKHKDENVRAESRSGGIFTALSDYVIENGGVVFGCILDDCFNATHMSLSFNSVCTRNSATRGVS